VDLNEYLSSPSSSADKAYLAAGMNFLAGLKKTAATGQAQTSKGAQTRLAAAGNQGVTSVKPAVGRAVPADMPGTNAKFKKEDGYVADPKAKTASLGGLFDGLGALGRAAGKTGKGVAHDFNVQARGLRDGALGERNAAGLRSDEGSWLGTKLHNFLNRNDPDRQKRGGDPGALRQLWGKLRHGKPYETAEDRARARGPAYYAAWLRGKHGDEEYGVSSLFDKANTTFRGPDGSFTPLSIADGLHRSGMLTKGSIAEAVHGAKDYTSKLPEMQRKDTRNKMLLAAGAAGAGAGVGGIALGKYMNKKKAVEKEDE